MRTRHVLALLGAAALCYWVQLDGYLQANSPTLTIAFADNSVATPVLLRNPLEPKAVYVVLGARNADGSFQAMRVDLARGQRADVSISIGPQSGYTPFLEGQVATSIQGLAFGRLKPYLMRLPGGGGPGFEWVDSQTGLQRLSVRHGTAQRTLAKRWVYNSGTAAELRARAFVDAAGQYAAVLSRISTGWTLYVFDLGAG